MQVFPGSSPTFKASVKGKDQGQAGWDSPRERPARPGLRHHPQTGTPHSCLPQCRAMVFLTGYNKQSQSGLGLRWAKKETFWQP